MSGILSIVREIASLFFPDKIPPRSIFWNCIIIAFVLSASILWYLEHIKLINISKKLEEEKKRNKPNLILNINQVVTGYTPEIGGIMVFIDLAVRNLGSPSIAYSWKLSVKSPIIKINKESPTLIPDGYELKNENNIVIARFHKNNRLEENTMIPIQQGALIGGWLRFILRGIKVEHFRKEAIKTIYVKDVLDYEYSVSVKGEERDNELFYYPSSGDNPFLNIKNIIKNP